MNFLQAKTIARRHGSDVDSSSAADTDWHLRVDWSLWEPLKFSAIMDGTHFAARAIQHQAK